MALPQLCDLQIHLYSQQTFFLHQKVLSRFCGKLRKIIKQEKKKSLSIEIDDFPGGAEGFELISRFCYSKGKTVNITVANVSILHCCAVFLGMTEKVCPFNLLHQTQIFLEEMFYWSWHEILTSLKSCEPFFLYADSCGLIPKFMNALLAKIAQNSDISALFGSSSSSSSSPDNPKSNNVVCCNSKNTPELMRQSSRAWWFDDMTVLSPRTVEQFVRTLGAFGSENNSLVLTKFLLHYLKTAAQRKGNAVNSRSEYSSLADTAVHGVVVMGTTAFSCRNLFWVLRIVSGFGMSRECRGNLENMIGGILDQATLDDLLVCGHNGSVYDVNLVLRLIRLFVEHTKNSRFCKQKMLKVGGLVDRYLGEIAPDQSLKISRFLGIAESLPDDARDCFDGVYRAIDIYLESHPALRFEERSRLCRCLNYEKLSLEACKDLAKNPRIPPRIAVQALASQCSNVSSIEFVNENNAETQMVLHRKCGSSEGFSEDQKSEDLRLNLQRMQWRVVELEKVCNEMKGQMTKMVKTGVITSPANTRPLPRLC